jgi:hypothetical protein
VHAFNHKPTSKITLKMFRQHGDIHKRKQWLQSLKLQNRLVFLQKVKDSDKLLSFSSMFPIPPSLNYLFNNCDMAFENKQPCFLNGYISCWCTIPLLSYPNIVCHKQLLFFMHVFQKCQPLALKLCIFSLQKKKPCVYPKSIFNIFAHENWIA